MFAERRRHGAIWAIFAISSSRISVGAMVELGDDVVRKAA